jgi:hypothetical protein
VLWRGSLAFVAVGESWLARGYCVGLTGADSVFGDVAESVEGLVIVPAGVLCVGDVVEESLLFDTIAIMMNRPISARSPNRAFLPAGVTPVDEAGIGGWPWEY